ncbi:polysaccharide deacetylase family protein [Sphingomonas sp. 35-24ZXX]|uniref:polysaccharide deacetylase family protein n=1 Tax=Sphingomonas sp. 35-24ZXX TaxID=1545915 RepID=UPI00053BE556|nr:polysaccharide deacetylase family protein [Sphingomonas sp. 35-24ZXX]
MTLDPACMAYPMRRRGMDHDLYAWSNIHTRPALAWPGGCRIAVAIMISLEWFPILPAADAAFKAPGHMQTAYPDFRHYTSREYGTRIGLYRMLDACAQVGARVSVATNAAIAQRYPSIITDIVSAGHEIVAHSTEMDGTIDSSLPEARECALITQSLDILEVATGQRPRGWMSIARSQSFNTPRLLKQAGLAYMCDWPNDDLPYRFETPAGPITNVPLNHELSDRQIITVQQHSADSYVQQIQDAHAWLASEAAPRMLPLHVTPYILGLPYRIGAFERLLRWLAQSEATDFLTTGEIASALSPSLVPEHRP